MLANLVGEEKLTTEEAAAILQTFDAGELGSEELPLPPAQSAILIDAAASRAAMEGLTSTLNVTANRIRVVPIDTRRRFVVRILDDMDSRAFQAARELRQGPLSVRDWHQRMKNIVRDDLLQQATLGKGRPLTQAELARMQDVLDEQAGYLKRFAEEVAARDAVGKPMSEAAIRSRAQMYHGRGYAEFWRQAEAEAGGDTIINYRARDDNRTCSPCVEAEQAGPYLPGEGPMPGEVCLGRGHCRCWRERERNPEEAARLRGEAVAA